MIRTHRMPFGATASADGVHFAIWAPSVPAASVEVDGRLLRMDPAADGFFYCFDPDARPGSRYAYRFEGVDVAVPDPASRFNPDGVHAASEVIAPAEYAWRDASWRRPAFHGASIYELHVGTFTPQGTYAAAAERLDHLAELGVSAIELMPLAATPGRWNWGYDGVLPFAPHAPYGRPEDLKRFIEEAHARGLMVLLDVVYNHFGPDGNYLGHYAQPFFTARHKTPWGNALNFDGESSNGVRQFFIHNALYWLEEFHFDGLRLDAVHTIIDDSNPTFLRDLATAVHTRWPDDPPHLVLENDRNDAALLERDAAGEPQAYTAQWNDDFHHALLVLLTGEKRGHYADFRDAGPQLLRALREGFAYQGEYSEYRSEARGAKSADLPLEAFVNFLQNHDQIGNRPDAARMWTLVEPRRMFAAETLLALLPTPILMFMGDEFHASSLFPFFCDHSGELGRAVTEGRRAEFGSLWHDVDLDAVPGPTTAAARDAAILDWTAVNREPHSGALERSRHRLALRRKELVPRLPARSTGGSLLSPASLLAHWELADGATLTLAANLADVEQRDAPAVGGRRLLATSSDAGGRWPPWYVAWSLSE